MPLQLKSFARFKSDMISSFVTLQQIITDFSVGSVSNALFQSISTQLGFLQNQAVYLLSVTRAANCQLPDLITFVSDYFLTPPYLMATYSTGFCTFTRYQPSSTALVLLDGTIVQTLTPVPAAALQAVTIADPTDQNWSPNAGGIGVPGRTLAAGRTSLSALVRSTVPGSGSGFAANTIRVVSSAGVPFDLVTNPLTIANGADAESAAALRVRYQKYVSSLAKGSLNAVGAAILSVQAGLTYVINEGLSPLGVTQPSNAAIVVDDGSGATPNVTLLAITAAVDIVRDVGPSRTVTAATPKPITVVVTGSAYYQGFSAGAVSTAIQTAIIAWVQSNGVGGANAGNSYAPTFSLPYVGLLAVIGQFVGLGPGQGYIGYSGVTLNGGTANVPISGFQVAQATPSTVTVS